MSMIHDIIKIKYISDGYLPDYPYHMISDEEMCNAFISDSNDDVFHYYYPCINSDLEDAYNKLTSAIRYHITSLLSSAEVSPRLPDWVYSYMLGSTIGPRSEILDKHDLLVMLNLDNIDDIFTSQAATSCLDISKNWIKKLPNIDTVEFEGKTISTRPPTMFGEPHVVKSLRLQQINLGR